MNQSDHLLAAIYNLHGVGLLHRDVSPKNIILIRIGNKLYAILVDFDYCIFMDRKESLAVARRTVSGHSYRSCWLEISNPIRIFLGNIALHVYQLLTS